MDVGLFRLTARDPLRRAEDTANYQKTHYYPISGVNLLDIGIVIALLVFVCSDA